MFIFVLATQKFPCPSSPYTFLRKVKESPTDMEPRAISTNKESKTPRKHKWKHGVFHSNILLMENLVLIIKRKEKKENKRPFVADYEFWKYIFTLLLPWECSTAAFFFFLGKGKQILILTSDAALMHIAFSICTKHHILDWYSNNEYNRDYLEWNILKQ